MKRVFFLSIVFAILVAGGTKATENEYLGFRLAQPDSIPRAVWKKRFVLNQFMQDVRLIVAIDREGGVASVTAESVADSTFADFFNEYLNTWRWRPAELEGNAVDSRIMISALFMAGTPRPQIAYPGDGLTSDATSDLRFESFRLNGIEPPRFLELPSLSLLIDKSDTSNFCTFAVLELSLDSTGRVVSSHVVNSNAAQHLPKLESAMLWSIIEPARVNGRAVDSKVNIALTFSRNINYPTSAWKSCCLDQLNLLQRQIVRLLLDTSGFLIPPIPLLPPGDSVNLGRGYELESEKIFCRVEVKKSGKAIWHIQNRISPKDNLVVRSLTKGLRFFPAIGSNGETASFSGYGVIHRRNSKTIRIEYCWLNQGRLSEPSSNSKNYKEIR